MVLSHTDWEVTTRRNTMPMYKELCITKSDEWSKPVNKKRKNTGRPSKFNVKDFVELKKQGYSHESIAKKLGCGPSTVTLILTNFEEGV